VTKIDVVLFAHKMLVNLIRQRFAVVTANLIFFWTQCMVHLKDQDNASILFGMFYTYGDSDVISSYQLFSAICGASSAKCLLYWRQ